jgi:uncharacterized repeat protein (TIGR01451 family)
MKTFKVLLIAMLFMAIASPAKACNCAPELTVEKECPPISKVGDEVCYTVTIKNTGNTPLQIIQVVDSLVGPLANCVDVILDPNEECIDEFCYVVQPGDPDPLENTVTVEAKTLCCCQVLEEEASCSTDLVEPGLAVEKICPEVSKVGDEACYELVLENTGEVPVLILDAFDTSYGSIVEWIGQIIFPGELWSYAYCIIVPPDAPNPFPNEAFVFGEVLELGNIMDANDVCEVPLVNPEIDLEKTVDNPEPCYGDTVTYTICIENTGDWPLENVEVKDSLLSPIYGSPLPGFPPILFPGEIWCGDFTYVVQDDDPCPLENCAEVTANAIELGNPRNANDCAEICPQPCGGEGCTPGFWKNNGDKHGASAWCDRFSPSDLISDHFMLNETLVIRGKGKSTISDPTLLQALDANGGGVNAMIRHGIAAMLNACSDCVQYEYSSPDEVISMIEGALNGDGPYTVGELHSMFAEANEAGCPVNQHGECVGVEEEIDG